MAIDLNEVNRIAKLARLSFNDSEKQKLQQELSTILDYLDQLKEVQEKADVEQAPDPASVNLMREDIAEPRNPEDFLTQAPGRQGNFIKVKSVLD